MTDYTVTAPATTVTVTAPTPQATVDAVGVQGAQGIGLPITFFRSGPLSPIIGQAQYPFPFAARLTSATVRVATHADDGDITVVIKKNGSPVATVILPDHTSAVTESLNVPVAVGDYVSMDIDTVGATYPGANLTAVIQYDIA